MKTTILLLLLLSLIYATQLDGADTKQNISIIALIDNSGSMDIAQHDKEGLRFQAAKILIDKCKASDNLAFVDFSGKSILLQPLTKITGDKKQKEYLKRRISSIKSDRRLTDIDSALKTALQEFSKEKGSQNKKAVVLLTDGEIDTVVGSKAEKQRAAQHSEKNILNNTVHGYLQNDIAIYSIALTDKSDLSFLEKVADIAKPPRQEEKHYFFSPSNTQLVDIFSTIINQMRQLAVSTRTFQVDGEVVQSIPLEDPLAEEAEFQFTFEKGKKVGVRLRDPSDKIVQPTATEDTYQLYSVQKPKQGIWKATITSGENATVTQTTAVAEDIQIAMPFPSKFQNGIPLDIIANIKYKGRSREENQFSVEINGYESTFSIEKLTVQIQHPNGTQKGPYTLQNRYGDYMFTYKSADMPGLYVLRFELNGNISGQDVKVRTEKQVTVVADTGIPFLTFCKLKDSYSISEPINLEIELTKNVDSMHTQHVLAHVSAPNGSSTILIPRKGRKLYGLAYEQTSVKGEYTFTIAFSREYAIKGNSQKVTVLPSQNSSPVIPIGIIALGAILVGCLLLATILVKRGIFQKRTKLKPKKTDAVIEAIENIKKDISQELPEETPTPPDEVASPDDEPDEDVARADDEAITPTEQSIVEAALNDILASVPDEKVAADDEEIAPTEPDMVEVTLNEILANVPDKIVYHGEDGIIQLSFLKKKDAVSNTSFLQVEVENGQVLINDKMIYQSKGKGVNNDTIKIGAFGFKVLIEDENMQLQPDDITRTLLESTNINEEIDGDGLTIWNIK